MSSSNSPGPWRSLQPHPGDFLTPLNALTLSRLLLIVPLFHFLRHKTASGSFLAVGVLALWAFGDWLDGYLARTRKMGNELGVVLDPLVDRISTAAALVLLAFFRDFPAWAAAAFGAREAAQVLAGLLVAVRTRRGRPSSILGKVNQWVIGCCMVAYVVRLQVAVYLLGLALATAILTTVSYALSLRGLRAAPARTGGGPTIPRT